MATDALLERGLELATLSPTTRERLRAQLLPEASVANPVDVIAGGGPAHVRTAVSLVAADPNVDMVLVIYTPPVFVDEEAVVRAIVEPDRHGKPLVACVLGHEQGIAFERLTAAGVPTFVFPEPAVRAMAAHLAYANQLRRDPGRVPRMRVDPAHARAIVERNVRAGATWLAPEDAFALMAAYGIPVVGARLARSASEAGALAKALGRRVALKAVAPGLVHKTEAGGVKLDVPPDEAAAAFEEMARAVAKHGFPLDGALVQPMLKPGREVILGMSADPKFGPLLMFGLGGVHVEVLKDVVFRLAPLTDADASRMVRAIRGWPLLAGVRGEAPADVEAIEDALLRLSQLVIDHPAIAEIDINPLIVGEKGAEAPDARVRLWPGGTPPKAAAVTPELHTNAR